MYPDAERHFRSDVRIITDFCKNFAREHVQLMTEIEKQFATEVSHRLSSRGTTPLKRAFASTRDAERRATRAPV